MQFYRRTFPSLGRLGYARRVRRGQLDRRRGLACAIALVAAGCAAQAPAEEQAEATDEELEEQPSAAERPTHVSAGGIEARLLQDGRVHLEGTDRFGAPLSVTYADATYFLNAVPVLARSLTPAQADALRTFGEGLPPRRAP